MSRFGKGKILNKLLELGPILILYIAVLNEFDFNYLKLDYFSFNFIFIFRHHLWISIQSETEN